MRIKTSHGIIPWLLTLVGVALFLVSLAWLGKYCLAISLAAQPAAENLERAARLDPSNSDYHLKLGRQYEYNIATHDREKAKEHFEKAAELNPDDPRPWLELALAASLDAGGGGSDMYLQRAAFLAPHLPAVHWPIANTYLLKGDIDEAFRHFRVVLTGSSRYDRVIFRTAWKASGDSEKILRVLIPRNLQTEFNYLSYLASEKRFSAAHSLWERINGNWEQFRPQLCAGYIDALIAAGLPDEAHEVWIDLQKKGLVGNFSQGPDANLINNGDFEDDLVGMGFSWRLLQLEDAYVGLDTSRYHSPGHSLLVQFRGKENLNYRGAYQIVKVHPNQSYQLEGFMLTESITTDSGPRLEVRDPQDPSSLRVYSVDLKGSTPSWYPVAVDFRTGVKTELIVVSLTRLPTRKLDNLISGKVWLDDVRLLMKRN